MRRASKLESTNGISFLYLISHIDDRDTAWNFDHADCNQGHFANQGILGINYEDVPCWYTAQESLWIIVVVYSTQIHAGIL